MGSDEAFSCRHGDPLGHCSLKHPDCQAAYERTLLSNSAEVCEFNSTQVAHVCGKCGDWTGGEYVCKCADAVLEHPMMDVQGCPFTQYEALADKYRDESALDTFNKSDTREVKE